MGGSPKRLLGGLPYPTESESHDQHQKKERDSFGAPFFGLDELTAVYFGESNT